ncbi:MAG: hypothetical protein R6V26_12445 [Roseovarius sp.]
MGPDELKRGSGRFDLLGVQRSDLDKFAQAAWACLIFSSDIAQMACPETVWSLESVR